MKYNYRGDYDGDLWQALVNKVMELRFCQMWGFY
jgi:hypothetical protein